MVKKPTYEELEQRVKKLEKKAIERRLLEEKLKEHEETLQALLNAPTETAILVDLNGKILAINKVATQRLGKNEDEALGLDMFDYLPSDVAESRKAKADEVIRSGKSVRFQDERAGKFYDINIYPVFDVEGKVAALAVYAKDITKTKQTEEALRESEEKYRLLAENAKDMIYRMSLPDGHYEYVSPSSINMFGYTPKEFYESSILIRKIIHPDWIGYFEDQWENLISGNMPPFYEYQIIHKSGEERWIHQRNVLILDDNGQPKAIEGIVTDITERKLAEEALRESENIFNLFMEHSPIYVFFKDENLRSIRLSRNYEQMLGRPIDELLGKTMDELFPSDIAKSITADDLRILNEGKPISIEEEFNERFYETTKFPILINGKPKYLAGFTIDITERNETEQRLKESKQKIMLHMQQTMFGVIQWNLNFEVIEWNPAAEKIFGYSIFGYSREEALGQHAASLIVSESVIPHVDKIWNQLLEQSGGTYSTNENVTKDGSILTCEWFNTPLVNNEGVVTGVASFVQDITQRKKTEEKLLEEKDFVERLIETIQAVVLVMDTEGRIVLINRFMEDLSGYKLEEVRGKEWFSTFLPKKDHKRIRSLFMKAIDDIQTRGNVNVILTKDGQEIYIEWNDKTLKDVNDKTIGLISVGLDITDRKRSEEERERLESQLQQAQKMEAIGTLAGGIAHDFNNILFPIIGYTEMSIEDIPEDSEVRNNLAQVLQSAHRAKDLVKQILTLSRQHPQETKLLKIQSVVEEALKLLRASIPKTIEIRRSIEECEPVLADSTQIHQIVMNLCTNAYHAMRETGGVLEVNLLEEEINSNDIETTLDLPPGRYIKLTITDTGHGMDNAVLERIFDPYYTTKSVGEGSGLGLAVVHGIVKSNRGEIEVESEPGEGTSFHIYFPLIDSGVNNHP